MSCNSIKSTCSQLIILLAVLAYIPVDAQTRSLFNGKNFDGWHADVPEMDKNGKARNPFILREKMLVSLWKVDDKATVIYMNYFYEAWLSWKSAYQAYQEAQTQMMQHEVYSHPKYWAAFVMLE